MNIEELMHVIDQADTYRRYGKVSRVVGLMIESLGPAASIGEVCYIYSESNLDEPILAEVVGFNNEKIILMPYTEVSEISPGCLVESTQKPLTVHVGRGLIGKVVDALGNVLDGSSLPKGLKRVTTEKAPPNPMTRPPIHEPIQVGVRSIDSLLTLGKGQRI